MNELLAQLIETALQVVGAAVEVVVFDAQLAVQTFVVDSFTAVERTLAVGGDNPTGMGALAVLYVVAGAVVSLASLKRLR